MTQALGNITSANAVLVLGVEELYPVGVQLTNFSTDQMLSSDAMEIAQVRMGVDGGMAAGYVANPFAHYHARSVFTVSHGHAVPAYGNEDQQNDL